jgi:hypothetical protein
LLGLFAPAGGVVTALMVGAFLAGGCLSVLGIFVRDALKL